jgi:hypothetical protein
MKKFLVSSIVISAIFVFASTSARAALIGAYVDGTDNDAAALVNIAPQAPGAILSNLSNIGFEGGSSITRTEFASPSTPAGPTAGSGVGSQWLFSRANKTQATPGTNTDYYGFTVDAAVGRVLDLTDLRFDRTSRANSGGGINTTYEVFASVEGGAFASYGSSGISAPAALNTWAVPSTQVTDLSSITGAESVEIRIALGDNSGVAGKSSWVQGIQLQGDVIRKPSTLLAYYVDGTDEDAAALVDLASAASVAASNLSNVGFEGGGSITRPSFGAAPLTPAGPTAASAAGSEWLFARANRTQATPGTNTDYFGFTIDMDEAGWMDLSDLTFDTTNRANTGGGINTTYEVFAAVDGGLFNSLGFTSITAPSTLNTFLDPAFTHIVDLTSIMGAKSVELRIALGDNSGVASKSSWVQGIQVYGDVTVIPEPSTLVLSAFGLVGLLRSSRRRQTG